MLLTLVLACVDPKATPEPADTVGPREAEATVELSPYPLDFGAQGAVASATLSVLNHGELDATLVDLSATEPGISLSAEGEIVPAGGALSVDLTWTPEAPGALDAELSVLVLTGDHGPVELREPAVGTASWGSVDLALEAVNFGTVSVGCARSVRATLSNTGTEDLVIEGAELRDGASFTLTGVDGALAPFPWTLPAGGETTFKVRYEPLDDVGAEDLLQIRSDDPRTPLLEADVYGIGVIEADNSLVFIADERAASAVLFGVNEVAVFGSASLRLADALPTFFDALNDSGVEYRVAFLTRTNGAVHGDEVYIDDHFSTDEAMDAFEVMVEDAMGDNDYMLDTFSKALVENQDWLFDEADKWEASRLSLIAINNDVEQSPSAVTSYLNTYWSYKDDPADIAVHAIAGPPPRGCETAEPADMLYDAAAETDGLFLTWCEDDWTEHLRQLADAVIADRVPFLLTGEPAAWSVTVFVSGTRVTEGWTYDEDSHEVVFDEDAYPAPGAEVRIDYIMATTCDDDGD